MWRNIASNAMTLIVVFLFLIGGVMTLLKAQYYKPGPLTEAICLKDSIQYRDRMKHEDSNTIHFVAINYEKNLEK